MFRTVCPLPTTHLPTHPIFCCSLHHQFLLKAQHAVSAKFIDALRFSAKLIDALRFSAKLIDTLRLSAKLIDALRLAGLPTQDAAADCLMRRQPASC